MGSIDSDASGSSWIASVSMTSRTPEPTGGAGAPGAAESCSAGALSFCPRRAGARLGCPAHHVCPAHHPKAKMEAAATAPKRICWLREVNTV